MYMYMLSSFDSLMVYVYLVSHTLPHSYICRRLAQRLHARAGKTPSLVPAPRVRPHVTAQDSFASAVLQREGLDLVAFCFWNVGTLAITSAL